MAAGSFFWHVVLPVERQNLIDNPSFEFGTAGWAGTGASVAAGTSAAGQAFGAWAMTATGATDGLGATVTTASLGSGSAVTASAYVRVTGASGGSAEIGIGGTTYRTNVGSAWQRVAVGTVQTSTTTRTVAVQRWGNVGASGTLWVDGVQAEYGSVTTYVDGDQEGCLWLGAPHASQSYRSGTTRAGGSVVPLASLGLRAETSPGIGVAPTINISQPRAVLDGAEYQRTRYDLREFTLTATFTGTTTEDLHSTRRRVFDALKVDRVSPQQPTRFLYTGAAGTTQIDALYAGGMEMTDARVIDDQAAVRFTAFDPMWYGVTDQGTALNPYTVLGSVNFIAYRDPLGRWGTMGESGTSVIGGGDGTGIVTIYPRNGTVFVGGQFFRAGGTVAHMLAQYAGGAWGTLNGGALGTTTNGTETSIVYALTANPGGTLFFGGRIDETIAGTRTGVVGLHVNNGYGSLSGGTIQAGVVAIIPDPMTGGVYVGGNFSSAGGTTALNIARWTGAWGTLNGGTLIAPGVNALGYQNGSVFAVGAFPMIGGGSANGLAHFSGGSTGTFIGRGLSPPDSYGVIGFGLDQRCYLGGNNQTDPRIARPGGIGSVAGLTHTSGAVLEILTLDDGDLLWSGYGFTLYGGSIPLNLSLLRWNGYSWIPADLRITTATSSQGVYALAQSADGTIYAGGKFQGPGTAAFVAPVINTGMAPVYPTLRIRNTGAGTARIYQLLNATTGDDLYFNLVALGGEMITLDLTPGERAFTSTTRGNLISSILGGSNLATWRLMPGTNWVSFFSDSANIVADLYWRPRHQSADGGAEPTL